MKNYIKLENRSLFHYHYAFLDTDAYMADQLFIKHKIKVDFGQEYKKEGTPYRIICCKVKKENEPEFLTALNEMYNKAVLLGYEEYEKYSEMLVDNLEEPEAVVAKRRRGR